MTLWKKLQHKNTAYCSNYVSYLKFGSALSYLMSVHKYFVKIKLCHCFVYSV